MVSLLKENMNKLSELTSFNTKKPNIFHIIGPSLKIPFTFPLTLRPRSLATFVSGQKIKFQIKMSYGSASIDLSFAT